MTILSASCQSRVCSASNRQQKFIRWRRIKLGITTAQMRMVAAHNWDITGAMRAGCAGAFVARPGMVMGPLDEVPDIIGPDLEAVAMQIIEHEI